MRESIPARIWVQNNSLRYIRGDVDSYQPPVGVIHVRFSLYRLEQGRLLFVCRTREATYITRIDAAANAEIRIVAHYHDVLYRLVLPRLLGVALWTGRAFELPEGAMLLTQL